MKILHKFILTFSIIIVISIGLVSFFSIQYLESAVIDSELQEMKKIAELKGLQVQTLHDHASQSMIFAMKNPKFIEYFELSETKAGNNYDKNNILQYTPKQNEIKSELEQWIFHFQNKFQVDETCIIDTTGQEHARLVLKNIAPVDDLSSEESSAPFFEPSFEKNLDEVHIQYPYVSPDTNRWVFAYTSPVVLGDGEKPAFYHFEMPITLFQSLVEVNQGRMYVVDPDGFIIADSQNDSIANAKYNVAHKNIDSFTPSKYFPSIQTVSATSEYSFLIKEMISEKVDIGSYIKNNEKTFVAYERLPTFDWILVYEKPLSLMLSGSTSINELETIIGTISVITALAGILFAIALSLKITRPLSNLAKWSSSQDVKNLSKISINQDDEIGKVGKSLNNMIDEISKYEEKISQQLEKLQELDIKKDEFASMVTHELKTPLTPIIGFATMLKNKGMIGELNPEQDEAVKTIFDNAKHLNKLIGDLLDVEKLALGKMKFDHQEINVKNLLNDVLKDTKQIREEKKIEIKDTTKNDIIIFSDYSRLRQVLNNLIYNAIDFVDENTGRIEINAQIKDSDVLFFVKDNGVGISKIDQKQLFTKFYQVDTSRTRKHGGTGLGLSVCHGIITGLGGSIWCDGTIKKGTTFYFSVKQGKL